MHPKWTVLSEEITATGRYYNPRLTPRKLSGRYCAGRAVIRQTKGSDCQIQAYAALWNANKSGWYELGTVWISAALRGNGLCRELMEKVVGLAPPDTGLFLFTDVASVMNAALGLGFVPVTTKTHPCILRWASKAGVVTRLPDSIHPIAPDRWAEPEAGERWLFMAA